MKRLMTVVGCLLTAGVAQAESVEHYYDTSDHFVQSFPIGLVRTVDYAPTADEIAAADAAIDAAGGSGPKLAPPLAVQNADPDGDRPHCLVRRGYAAVAFHGGQLCPDRADYAFDQKVHRVYSPQGRSARSWGAISAWAWGASRVMDWLETLPEIDAENVAVVNIHNPHWFTVRWQRMNYREDEWGLDAHDLAALVAPRLLAIGSASEDYGAGPVGANGNVSYHLRVGRHGLTLWDWNRYMDFADAHGWSRAR